MTASSFSLSDPTPVDCVQKSDGRPFVDFTDAAATRELSRAILEVEYGVREWTIPTTYLCPPVANRLNYLYWIEELLQVTRKSSADETSGAPLGLVYRGTPQQAAAGFPANN